MSKYSFEHKLSDNGEVTISAKVESAKLDEYKEKAYSKLSKEVKLKGFRPGKAPRNMIEGALGASLWEEALDVLLPDVVVEILKELSLEPITRVNYNVKKLDPKEGVEFDAVFVNFPEIKLADFSKINVKKDKLEVKEEDVDKVIENIIEEFEKNNKPKTDEAKPESKDSAKKESKKVEKMKVSEITDEWVKKLEMQNIETVKELRKQIELSVKNQREMQVEDKYQVDIMQEAIKMSNIKVPARMIEMEVDLREKNYKKRIEDVGLKFEDFLRNQKTSIEKLREQWTKEMEERLSADMLFVKIVKENKLGIESKEVEDEIARIEDPKMREEYDSKAGRSRIGEILLKQKAFKWLADKVPAAK